MSQRVIDLDQDPVVAKIKNLAKKVWNEFWHGMEAYGEAWLRANSLQSK